jgi:hypothetical protein
MTLSELRTQRALTLVRRARELRRTGASFRLVARELGVSPSAARTLCKGTVVESPVLRNCHGQAVEPWNESRRVTP